MFVGSRLCVCLWLGGGGGGGGWCVCDMGVHMVCVYRVVCVGGRVSKLIVAMENQAIK